MSNKTVLILVGILVVAIILYLKRKTVKKVITSSIIDAMISYIVAVNEGGSKVITDAGGLTKYGISQKAHPKLNIRNLTLDQAKDIYRTEYLGRLPSITDPDLLYQVLDMSINAGVGAALSIYKKGMTAKQYADARLKKYSTFKDWKIPNIQKSWTRRVINPFVA